MKVSVTSRKKEVFLTIASNLILQVVTALCGFVLPPLIIGTFGSAVNGMVSSISQFIACLNIVEAGVGGAAIAALYKPLALGDMESRNGILSATAKFYNRSGVLFTLLIFVLAFVYPLIVGGQVDRTQSALMVLVLGITGAAEFFLIGKYRVLLTADKKVYVISLLQMAALILNTAVAVILIKAGCPILVVKCVSAFVYPGRYVVLASYVRRKYADADFHATPDTQAISQSRNVLVHKITALVTSYSPVILITIFLTLKDASIYAVYSMVFSAVGNLLYSFGNGMQAFFGHSLVSETIVRTRVAFGRYETSFFAVAGLFYSLSYLLILPFMRLYTAGMADAEYVQPRLALFFVCSGIINYIRDPSCQMISAAGHFRQTQWMTVTEMLINLTVSILAVLKVGLAGILLGSMASYVFRLVTDTAYASIVILRRKPLAFYLKVLPFSAYFGVMLYVITLKSVTVASYTQWFLYAAACAFILLLPLGILIGAFFIIRSRYA